MKSPRSKHAVRKGVHEQARAVGHRPFDFYQGKTMKTLLVASLTLVFGISIAAAQTMVPSQIRGVNLFSNQALVTREATVQVRKGLNEILIDIEAFHADPDSVSARVFGEGELYSVQLKKIHLKEAPQDNIRALEEKLRGLKESRKALEDKHTALSNKERFLNSVIDFSKTQLPQDIKTSFPKMEDLTKTLNFLGKNFEEIYKQKQALNENIESVNKEIQVVEKELRSLTRPRQKDKKAIEVLFNADREQEIRIEAGYLVQNAFWQPLYKVDVPLGLKKVNLTMFSRIHQKTGEDWRDIELSISNVIPLRGARLPEIPSWILDIVRPVPRAALRDRAGLRRKREVLMAEGEMKEMKVKGTAPEEEAGFVRAQRKELPLSFEYRMPRKLTIESKDKQTMLPLFTKPLKGAFLYYAAPKVNPLSFLVCKATADKELLGGPMNVHFGTLFVGKTQLNEKKAGEIFDLNLGVDREVKIKREKITDKVKETFFGKFERKNVVRNMVFRITAENLKVKPITIHILDNMPVSRTDKIKVEDVKIKPEPTERNYRGKEGVFMWSFGMQPKEVKEIEISFVVSYPKDEPITGL